MLRPFTDKILLSLSVFIISSATWAANGVMSASDFSARVNTLSQQTKSNLAQQANDMLPKPGSQASTNNMSAPTTPTTGVTTSTVTTTPGNNYSGFGTSNPKPSSAPVAPTPSQPSTNSSSEGFNIKY